MKQFVKSSPVLWWTATAAVLLIEFAVFASDICFRENSYFVVNILRMIADIATVLLPFWLLPRRMRGSMLIAVWGLSIFFFVNAVYFRFFLDFMPPGMVFQAANANDVLINSVLALLRPSDAVYLAVPVLLSVLWSVKSIRRAVASQSTSRRTRLAFAGAILLLFGLIQYKNTISYAMDRKQFHKKERSLSENFLLRINDRTNTEKYKFENKGLPLYAATEVIYLLTDKESISIDSRQRASLTEFVRRTPHLKDSCEGKNLIFIIVESLNADVIGQTINGKSVTPVIDSLIAAENTYSCLNVVPQIRSGISSDGQLMYNLGILPLIKGVTTRCSIYGKKLPSLPGMLSDRGYRTLAAFADNGQTWNQFKAYMAYGYDRVRTIDHIVRFIPATGPGTDECLMKYAAAQLDSLPEPFFMELVTIDMHYPFWAGVGSGFAGDAVADEYTRRYINAVNMLDRHTGMLMDELEKRGLSDNTTIVIASDHCINMGSGAYPLKPIVFIATNCGHTSRITHPVGQIDVFPTVLDMMGLESEWRGVGHSMLGGAYGAVDPHGDIYGDTLSAQRVAELKRAYAVSDSILRSDWFR